MKTQTKISSHIPEKILAASWLSQILQNPDSQSEFRTLVSKYHPDISNHPEAEKITRKLNQLRNEHRNGKQYKDEAGDFFTNGKWVRFAGEKKLLQKSAQNLSRLFAMRDKASRHFQQYLPASAEWKNEALVFHFPERAVPLSGLELPQKHVNWILSRMLEFTGWLAQKGYVHAGLNPESVFVVPKTHGIIVTSFYHLTKRNQRLQTINANYSNWYPSSIFKEKNAVTLIDTELAKKTAINLLGDPSGSGVRLRRTHHPEFVDFCIAQHTNAFDCFHQYRSLLDRHFPKKFHPLKL